MGLQAVHIALHHIFVDFCSDFISSLSFPGITRLPFTSKTFTLTWYLFNKSFSSPRSGLLNHLIAKRSNSLPAMLEIRFDILNEGATATVRIFSCFCFPENIELPGWENPISMLLKSGRSISQKEYHFSLSRIH